MGSLPTIFLVLFLSESLLSRRKGQAHSEGFGVVKAEGVAEVSTQCLSRTELPNCRLAAQS